MGAKFGLVGATLAFWLMGCSDEEKGPCEELWADFCARAAECNAGGSEVVVLRTTPSGYLGLVYSDEADCAAGHNFCKEDGPIAECKAALTNTCDVSGPGEPQGIVLPEACNGID